MRKIRTLAGIGTVLSTFALLGCTSVGSPFAMIAGSKRTSDSPAASLGKPKSDEAGRPVPGSLAPPAIAESSSPPSSESRAHVELAMGEMLEEAGNLIMAQAHYEQALKVDPKSLKVSLALGRVYARLGRPDAALKVYQAAEKQHRKSAALYNDKGLLLAEQKDWAGGIAALRTAVKLESSESKYHNNLGMILAASGAYAEAWQEFREAVGPGPAHYNLAMMLVQAGRTTEARDHLQRALVAMPKLKEAATMLARLNEPSIPESSIAQENETDVDLLQVVGHLDVPVQTTGASSQESLSETPTALTVPNSNPWSLPRVPPKWLR